MAQTDKHQEEQPFTVTWGDTSELPLVVGDLLHWRTTADRCILTVGQIDFPVSDTPLLGEIPIKPVFRLLLTPQTVKAWAAIMALAASQFEPNQPKK